MSAQWLDCFPVGLKVLKLQLEMTGLVLRIAKGETFEIHLNCLCGGHVQALVAHNMAIHNLHWCLVVSCESYSMENGGKTSECLEIATVMEGNQTCAAGTCLNWNTGILDRCLPSYSSMTVKVIEQIWYDMFQNPTRAICSFPVSITRDITHKLLINDLKWQSVGGLWVEQQQWLLSVVHLVETTVLSPGSMVQSRIISEAKLPPSYQVYIIIEPVTS